MKKGSFCAINISQLLILTSCAKFKLNSLKNNEITIRGVFGSLDKMKVRNDVLFKQWLERYDFFTKFENYYPIV